MKAFLASLRQTGSLPRREIPPDRDLSSREVLPPPAVRIFGNLQNQIFGQSDLIQLKPCDTCEFLATYASKTVYIQPSEVKSLLAMSPATSAELLLTVILAHELSHFVHEASIGTRSAPGLSFNGNPSLYAGTPTDSATDINAIVQKSIRSHAEVDAYAFLILHRAGFPKPDVLLAYLAEFITTLEKNPEPDSWVGLADLKFRLEQDRKVLDEIFAPPR